jgi:poly-gamma-glutamate capsule biosynthesis protein CapA/YwtB (metallophosphatase superfamily)
MPTRRQPGSKLIPEKWADAVCPFFWIGFAVVLLVATACRPASGQAAVDLSGYPWLYLRGGQPLQENEEPLELLAVGDLMLGRDGKNLEDPFSGSAGWLSQADLTLGNLEGVVGSPTAEMVTQGPIFLVFPPSAIKQARQAGFDLLGLANNHALDLGSEGVQQTVEYLEQAGIVPLGVVRSADPEIYYQVYETGELKLAFLAVNAVPSPRAQATSETSEDWQPLAWDPQKTPEQVRLARGYADAVIVSIHWGYEYQGRQDPAQEAIARSLVEAGADLVIGHHPHTIQGTQLFVQPGTANPGRPAFCAYSLGNFVSDQREAETRQGLALRAWFDHDGLRAVQALPLESGPRSYLLPPQKDLALLEPQLPTLTIACNAGACQASPSSAPPVDGIFTSGSIDLTGDGEPEIVRLKDHAASIYQDGKLAWQSPPEWQVRDVALGDPNDDGRFEALLALDKPDNQGAIRSHPFIFGYRGGIYRQVWGGSAVSENILEVELADVTGDGVQDLLVLDEVAGQGMQTVGVWEWNGWGFNLSWRSEPGRYNNLGIPNPVSTSPALFQVSYLP